MGDVEVLKLERYKTWFFQELWSQYPQSIQEAECASLLFCPSLLILSIVFHSDIMPFLLITGKLNLIFTVVILTTSWTQVPTMEGIHTKQQTKTKQQNPEETEKGWMVQKLSPVNSLAKFIPTATWPAKWHVQLPAGRRLCLLRTAPWTIDWKARFQILL